MEQEFYSPTAGYNPNPIVVSAEFLGPTMVTVDQRTLYFAFISI